ncbi:ASCH domain-containing protein [Leuconostoc mesenteroides]|uniref:ASCH domain-containing protein n=1 Tax=Leuconostoc mesenteroides TaxID=1245 RepID=UPI002360A4D7|nr:ASCH domain-containing protein [Leuconostoc mesenteroides]WMS38831.1 ASCH domain-containing protein [Leuconostoc mesenteroides]
MTPNELFKKAQESNSVPHDAKMQSAFQFGVSADELADLVISGQKTATTSSLDLYEKDEPLPQLGAYDVVLDSENQAICVIQNDNVEIKNYLDVSEKHAYLEGEGDRSLGYWRHVHNEFFVNEYQLEGLVFKEQDAKMVLENFHVVYPVQ